MDAGTELQHPSELAVVEFASTGVGAGVQLASDVLGANGPPRTRRFVS